ncbi:ROK family transcriptional regulator [Agromyces italicus]|uniref:ROK family transcriptional regulator n=1 Tax=Agromyces italicus TaxID=279572 RepID=UPI0003B657C0|nr:ROK family transcriptional regulator [Agromyces italicus]
MRDAGEAEAPRADRATDILSLTPADLLEMRRSDPKPTASAHEGRQHNLAVILRLLYQHGPKSRPELARLSGLSTPTASALVAELVDAGTVRDLGIVAEARVGKPAAKVDIAADHNLCIVLDLTHHGAFTGAAIDLNGAVVDRVQVDIGDAQGETAVEHAVELANLLIERAAAQVIGIGVASPGLVDDEGRVRVADGLRWRDVRLADVLRRRTGVPAVVGNDVNLLALGLRRFRARSGRDAVVVAIDNGVGAAVLVNGQPVLGEQFAAGEIAHLTVDPGGAPCACGRRGCLDVVVGAPHLARSLAAEGAGILEPAGRVLGEVLAPVLNILNINVVVVLGPPALVDGPFARGVVDGVASRLRPTIVEGLEIEVRSGDPDLVLLGAAAAVMETQLGVH